MRLPVTAGFALMLIAASEPPVSIPLPGPDPTLPTVQAPALQKLADNRIRQAIIAKSIRQYGGECACPFQVDRHGRICGERAGNLSGPHHPRPFCAAADVSDDEVKAWRERRQR